ncbi:MAG TPA: response regulator transcription factor [Longimicrobium sp.]|nr:response regulator transcription factor [Longimicrobium sp.]
MSRILVVEDNANLAYGLTASLELEGHQVAVARDGAEGLREARQHPPDLVILDLMLPGMDGYRVLKTLREEGCEVPVLILTARGAESDKVLGFRLGADDYVTKPFGLLELLARVGALLRRLGRAPTADARAAPVPATVSIGEIEVSPAARIVRRRGAEVQLTP